MKKMNYTLNIKRVCYICKKEFSIHNDNKKYYQVQYHSHYTGKYKGVAQNLLVTYNTRHQKKIPVVCHNGCKYDHNFTITELEKEFEGQFNKGLGENAEKYITFSVSINKELKNGRQSHTK